MDKKKCVNGCCGENDVRETTVPFAGDRRDNRDFDSKQPAKASAGK